MTAKPKQTTKAAARRPRPVAALRDDTGAWTAGLRSEAHALLLGQIVGLMPQVEAAARERRAADARRGSVAGRPVAAMARYEAARKRWQAYIAGLWYTHDSGRAFLAPPDTAEAAFRVAREVKTIELATVVKQLDGLAAALARRPAPTKARAKAATKPQTAAVSPSPIEAARPKRRAPLREVGQRGRPGRTSFVSPPAEIADPLPEAAE